MFQGQFRERENNMKTVLQKFEPKSALHWNEISNGCL